ncbi:MAG: DUF2855 family protein, partial [Actinomycetota bacterium]|nr:DUF2855 family protein [Actinomycetota bacterium]
VLEIPAIDEIELSPGQVVLRVDNFSVTANNVTYAAMGEAMSYWEFFPSDEGLGRIPVWGYSEVARSEHDDVAVGTRLYGYMPMSTHFVVEPVDVSSSGFVDGAAHRTDLPAIYNRYGLATPESGDTPEREPYVALFAPLFTTSWLLADELVEENFHGAKRLLISSASSKTAIALAFLLQRDHDDEVELIGLTSARNEDFVLETGLFDDVIGYDDLEELDTASPTAYLDFGGNADLRGRIHSHFGESLVASTVVGAADWEGLAPEGQAEPLPGPHPGFFFAPTRIAKRNEDWGAGEVRRRVSKDQNEFIDSSKAWLTIRTAQGADGIGSTLKAFLDGDVDPSEGWTVTP